MLLHIHVRRNKYKIFFKTDTHTTDFASECTLSFGFSFIRERCKLFEFVVFLCTVDVAFQI